MGLARTHIRPAQPAKSAEAGFPEGVRARRTRLLRSVEPRLERRGGDSNPRSSYPDTGFRNRPHQPLAHLSECLFFQAISRFALDFPAILYHARQALFVQ
jgi:hypothetical protein